MIIHSNIHAPLPQPPLCRHLSNVFQGLLQARPNEFKDARSLALLWLHESERVYGDRLVCGEDLAKYRALASGHAKKKVGVANTPHILAYASCDVHVS